MGLFPRTYTVQEMAAACFSSAQGFPTLAESRSAEGGSPLPEREVAATATRVSSHKPLFSFSRAAAWSLTFKHGTRYLIRRGRCRRASALLRSLFLQAAGGGLKRRRKPGDTPDPGREDPAPLWAFVPCQFVNNHAAASKRGEKRFFGDTPNPGKGPRPLQSRLFKWYWPLAANSAAKSKEHVLATEKSGMIHEIC